MLSNLIANNVRSVRHLLSQLATCLMTSSNQAVRIRPLLVGRSTETVLTIFK